MQSHSLHFYQVYDILSKYQERVHMPIQIEGNEGIYKKNSDGFIEAVLFAFVKNHKLLVEHRLEKNPPELFIPNGKIENRDVDEKGDYKINALNREINEELSVNVKETDLVNLGEFKVDPIKVIFNVFMVPKWDGEVPNKISEEGRVIANLEWMDFETAREKFSFPVLQFTLAEIEKIVSK